MQNLRSPSPNRRFEMATGTPGTKLAQEIHDEFLVCKICLEVYTNPKCLACLHTFCEGCIENHVMSESTYKKYSDYREFTCPLCRKRTQLPIGGVKKLPDNFLVSSLSETIGRQRPSKFPFCDICKMVNRKHREASSKCLDCAKLLCKTCVELHKDTKVTKNHSIFDVEIEKDIECKEHAEEVVRFYCEPCETCICVLCTFNEHKEHEITQFGEAVSKYKGNIQRRLDGCKTKVAKFDSQIEALNKAEDVIQSTEQLIHETAIKFISEIRSREKQLIEEVHNIYGKDMMDQIQNLKDMTSQVDGLRSTCNLTEVILKGKDIELLLLKKDVQDKLDSLGQVTIQNLPATISKQVNFLPGDIDLGCIQDMDRPMLTKFRTKRIVKDQNVVENIELEFRDQMTQTDSPPSKSRARSSKKKDESDSDSDSESESDESDSDESESDSDEEESKKPEMEDKGVQTEPPGNNYYEKGLPDKIKMIDQSIYTDEISTEEKGVNTRSRSLQSLSNRPSPSKDNNEDNSLAARRRRRRERAQNASQGSYSSFDEDSDKRSNRYYSRNSIENDDMFYDAGEQGTAY